MPADFQPDCLPRYDLLPFPEGVGRRRAAIRELYALDDRMLKDIGISRGDIQYLVDQQLSAEQAATEGSAGHGEIAVFPDRKAADPSAGEPLRNAA